MTPQKQHSQKNVDYIMTRKSNWTIKSIQKNLILHGIIHAVNYQKSLTRN